MPLAKLKTFVQQATRIVESVQGDRQRMQAMLPALRELISQDDWLPEAYAQPDPEYYRQYLLHCDPLERFSVVSFVWGPGQQTPVHDHTVWGLVGMLRGSEISTPYSRDDGKLREGEPVTLLPGHVQTLLPDDGDIHVVRNAHDDRVSISIHVYGGNIGQVRRHTFGAGTGQSKSFVSGFSDAPIPNLWS